MKTIAEIRLANLNALIEEFGTQDKVSELCGVSPVYLSQLKNGTPDNKTGRPRQMGDRTARKLEEGCNKPKAWMDMQRPAYLTAEESMSLINGLKGAVKGVKRVREKRDNAPALPSISAEALDPDHMYCTTCGYIGATTSRTPGSIWIELILWLSFILPGLIYSAWRLNRRHEVCEKCGSVTLIPPDSPKALMAMNTTNTH